MIIARLETENGKLVGLITLMPKQFSTGSKGFFGQGQTVIDGKRYQANFQLIEIGTKRKKR
jgi:hypothetical protein